MRRKNEAAEKLNTTFLAFRVLSGKELWDTPVTLPFRGTIHLSLSYLSTVFTHFPVS